MYVDNRVIKDEIIKMDEEDKDKCIKNLLDEIEELTHRCQSKENEIKKLRTVLDIIKCTCDYYN